MIVTSAQGGSTGGGLSEPLVLTQVLTLPATLGVIFNPTGTLKTSGTTLQWIGGALSANGFLGTQTVMNLQSNVAQTSASVPSAVITGAPTDQANAWSTAIGTSLGCTNPNTSNLARFGYNITTAGGGTYTCSVLGSGKVVFDATDASGTPGAATINKPSGQAAVASGASSVVVTNSCVSTTSVVHVVLQDAGDVGVFVHSVVPASGSFTVTLSAVTTAARKIGFVVFN